MKLTIKSNGIIRAVEVEPKKVHSPDCGDSSVASKEVNSIEIDFTPSQIWSDFELWLEGEDGQVIDYKRINISKRNKMQMS